MKNTLVIEAQRLSDGTEMLVLTKHPSYKHARYADTYAGLPCWPVKMYSTIMPEQPMKYENGELRYTVQGNRVVLVLEDFKGLGLGPELCPACHSTREVCSGTSIVNCTNVNKQIRVKTQYNNPYEGQEE